MGIFPIFGRHHGHSRASAYLFIFLAMGVFASCHPRPFKTQRANITDTLSTADSLLSEKYPLPAHLQAQKELLLKYSQPAKKVLVPDRKAFEGDFNQGTIELILDEIDGEPMNFYGHRAGTDPPVRMQFIIYGVPNVKLDHLVAGQKYRVHWIETVVNTEPFDDDRYREFLVYGVEGGVRFGG